MISQIRQFFENLDLTLHVSGVSVDNGNTTLTVADALHAREGMAVFVDFVEATIVSVSANTCGSDIVIDGEFETPNLVELQALHVVLGTYRMANQALSAQPYGWEKYPCVFLASPVRSSGTAYDSEFDKLATIRTAFLDEADFANWEAIDYYEKRLNGLQRLAAHVERMMNADRRFFGKLSGVSTEQMPKFGVFVDNAGSANSLFNDRLTGVSFSATVPIKSNCIC